MPLALALLLGANVSLAQVESEPAILQIVTNGQDYGQKFVRLTSDGDVLLTRKVLEALRLKPALWEDREEGPVSLRALSDKLEFDLNKNDAVLTLTLSPRWFKEQVITRPEPPAPAVKTEPLRPEPMSAFLNYNIRVDATDDQGGTGIESPLEIGINRGQWLALSTFGSRYDLEEERGEGARGFTTLFWDDPENLRTVAIGDFTQPYGLLQGGGSFAGVALRRNFRMAQGFRYTADLGLDAQIDTPTHAELRVNGRVAREWDLLPGIVRFPDIGSYASGDAVLVLTDAFGRQRTLQVPSLASQSVLRKGVHDYAYGFGWQRENRGQPNATYGEPAVMGLHRYGFGNTWTAGIEFAATENALAAGPSLVAVLGGFSQAEFGFVVSDADKKGYKATAHYTYHLRKLNGSLRITGTSRDYTSVPQPSSEGELGSIQPRVSGSASLTYADADLGSFGLSYSESRNWNPEVAPTSRGLALTYNKQIRHDLQLGIGFRHDTLNGGNDQGYLSLRYYPAAGSTFYDNAGATVAHSGSDTETLLELQKTPSADFDGGYAATLSESDGNLLGHARGQYKNSRGLYTATATVTAEQTRASVSAAGGVALLDGGLYQGRPITDSFAVVEVEGLESVSIVGDTSTSGVVREGEGLLVPDLASYKRNELAVLAPSLSMRYTSKQMSKIVEVGQRSGSLVKFKFTRFSAVEGSVYLAANDGREQKLEHVPIEYTVNGETRDAFVGDDGYFYLENLPVGKTVLRVRLAGGDCLATADVPDSDKIVVSLGELACVRGGGNEQPMQPEESAGN